MGYFYFDESIHPRGNFALGAFVYSETPLDTAVRDALEKSGLDPNTNEFKSGVRIDHNPKSAIARDHLKAVLLNQCGIAVVVAPASPRNTLGEETLQGLNKVLSTTSFHSKTHTAFFDEGLFSGVAAAERETKKLSFAQPCDFRFEQDSRQVRGLQVADLVAHMAATMLLAQLGLVKKTVKAGPNSGYDPDSDMPLDFELWATLRRRFFSALPPPFETWKSQLNWQVDVASRGLHVSDSCDAVVKTAALARFGKMYLGCIH